jgi:pyruvate/2-oxoglutarate dehydrogenase complex dihydrolipoamide acyltransferase (E2) component
MKQERKKHRLDRSDGYYISTQSAFSRLFNTMSPRRCDNVVFFEETIDVEKILKYRINHKEISMTHILVAALLETIKKHPNLNSFVLNSRLYKHKDVTISTIVKRELKDDADELIGKFKFNETDNIQVVQNKLTKDINKMRKDKNSDKLLETLGNLPTPLFKLVVGIIKLLIKIDKYPSSIKAMDPTYSSVFVANLGSIDLDAPFHHLYEWGTCSIFITMGVIHKEAIVVNDEIKIKNVCNIVFSIDERIGEGMKFETALKTFKYYLENPEELKK